MGKVSLKFFDLCSIMYFALTYTYTHRGSFFLRLQGSYSLYAGDVEDGILLAKGGEFMISESILITPPTASS